VLPPKWASSSSLDSSPHSPLPDIKCKLRSNIRISSRSLPIDSLCISQSLTISHLFSPDCTLFPESGKSPVLGLNCSVRQPQ
jgi:hypothetical protein